MVANTSPAGFLPKTAVVASRAVYYPFTIPTKLNQSATDTGKALNGMVGGINASVGNAYLELKPRGPAKWLLPIFDRVNTAVKESDRIAQRNKDAFWDPFSHGTESIGRAVAGPGAYWYLRKSGVEQPTAELIKGALEQSLFDFSPPQPSAIPGHGGAGGGAPAGGAPAGDPAPDPAADAAAAAAAAAAAQQAAVQAAEGAGEVQQPAAA